jgi:hypothetical protein
VGAIGNTWKLEEQLGVMLGAIGGTLWEHGVNIKIQKTNKTQTPHPQTKKLAPPQCILSPPQSSLSLIVLLGEEGHESLELMLPVRTHQGLVNLIL